MRKNWAVLLAAAIVKFQSMGLDAEGERFCNEAPMFTTMTNIFLLRQGSPVHYALFAR